MRHAWTTVLGSPTHTAPFFAQFTRRTCRPVHARRIPYTPTPHTVLQQYAVLDYRMGPGMGQPRVARTWLAHGLTRTRTYFAVHACALQRLLMAGYRTCLTTGSCWTGPALHRRFARPRRTPVY